MLARVRDAYTRPSILAPAKEEDFPHLDLSAYAGFQAELGQRGFSFIGDVEFRDLSEAAAPLIAKTMIRAMLSADGDVCAAYYQVKFLFWRRFRLLLIGLWNCKFVAAPAAFLRGMKTRHRMEFTTEFSDGRFLITINSDEGSAMSVPPSIERWFLPDGTPAATCLSRHLARLREIVDEDGRVQPLIMRSADDVLNMQARQKALKIRHRAAVQWITREELFDMSRGNQELADALYVEVQKILAKEQNDIPGILAKQAR
jgi:hypothetical protein